MIGERATLRDVARQAGVSLGTASNVINNRGNTSEEARTRVYEAAASLGYRVRARPMTASRQTLSVIGTIGKIDQDEQQAIAFNPFYAHVLEGIERECQRNNLSMMFANIEVDKKNRPAKLPPMLLDQHVDGILMVGTFLQDTIHLIGNRLEKPLVLVDAYAPGGRFDSVVTDNINGAYAAVKYLIQQGHEHIGLVGSYSDSYPSIRERRKGYLRALKYHKISHAYIEDSHFNRAGGYTATMTLLARAPRITAIFACNDEVAVGVYRAAHELGRRIPEDLSVVGFDDIMLAEQLNPALTTVHVDKPMMGMLAVRHLKDRAENPDRPTLTTLLSTDLIVRGSVRRIGERVEHGS